MSNMEKLSLVTFVSGDEVLRDDFLALADNLQQFCVIEVIVFVDYPHVNKNPLIRQIVSPGTTKYARILQLLLETPADYFLCVDNDITPNLNAVHTFLWESFSEKADLSWGRIGVSSTLGVITQLIKIDKMLSHCFIRPLLWRSGCGASIPGQFFLLKVKSFRERLSIRDTVFDDLTIGICAREHNCKVYFNQSILGWEKPKETLFSLLRQRVRWGKGFSEVVNANFQLSNRLFLVLVHGAAYHLLWTVFLGLIYITALINANFAFLLWLALAFALTFGQISLIPVALLYTIVFPVTHLVWLAVVIFYTGWLTVRAPALARKVPCNPGQKTRATGD